MNHTNFIFISTFQEIAESLSRSPQIPLLKRNGVIKQNRGWRRNRVYTLVVLKGSVDSAASMEKTLDECEA
ncbi:uncharacterized protein G2W53_040638 [Senna tora]|uniref:Uncharacterized protein n=1 Tax=Senna tora TaxID=362788 RepID=A0A834SIL4_9FABA|nr:uncharacterized protein G2W53_040638 [Senna tora]